MDNDAAAVAQLADALLSTILARQPVEASLFGMPGHEDRLPDFTEAGEAAARSRFHAIAEQAAAIDVTTLPETDRLTVAVVRQQALAERDKLDTSAIEYTITDTPFAALTGLLFLLPRAEVNEPASAAGYLTRLASLPAAIATLARRHRAGIAAGRSPVRGLVDTTVAWLDRRLAAPADDPLARPHPDQPDAAATFAPQRDRLLASEVWPALRSYRDLLATEIAPHSRPDNRAGLCWLPDGEASYAALVRVYTTTEHTPEELHEVGLTMMAQLQEELSQLGKQAFGLDEPARVRQRLADDPALRWPDEASPMAAARAAVHRAVAAASGWFQTLPAAACEVVELPESEAAGAPAGGYLPAAMDGSRPGTYLVNTYRATERDRYTSEATAFHEAVPGHHLQFTRAMELTDLPLIRRLGSFEAYSEGWGLYAERLADEMGLYSDDLHRLGMVSNDLTRAARMVVDTGLHAKGWSRQRVVEYLRAHTLLPEVEVQSETDRYVSVPGQALAYLVGRLEIQRIRAAAQQALGQRFDIRAFHDTVLGSGSLPLTVLDELVRDWTASFGRA